MEIKDIIRIKRLEKNLTLKELADKIGVSEATVSRWETGNIKNMKRKGISNLADVLEISPAIIMGWEEYKEFDENAPTQRLDTINFKPKIIPVKIPILGSVPTGIPIEAIEDIIGYEEIHPDMAKRGSFFALQIKGDSMLPILQEDDIVIVREQPDVESGDIAVIFNGDNEATVKQIKKEENGIWVIPFNTEHAFKKRFYHYEDENNSIRIVGKVVEQRRRF